VPTYEVTLPSTRRTDLDHVRHMEGVDPKSFRTSTVFIATGPRRDTFLNELCREFEGDVIAIGLSNREWFEMNIRVIRKGNHKGNLPPTKIRRGHGGRTY